MLNWQTSSDLRSPRVFEDTPGSSFKGLSSARGRVVRCWAIPPYKDWISADLISLPHPDLCVALTEQLPRSDCGLAQGPMSFPGKGVALLTEDRVRTGMRSQHP